MAVLRQNALLGQRYRLLRRIAIGGMGEVWRAEDTVLRRTVAVKVLKSELTTEATFRERFRVEAQTTAALSHPGIASIFDYGESVPTDGDPDDLPVAYLVMEFVEGEPLSSVLARENRLPADRVLDILRQAATALNAAHRLGMVHRDVKPGNLLVQPDGLVKITDFGVARVARAVPLTQNGMVVGTAQYFSPEQAEGRPVAPASDVYSLGVVAYECLTGLLPFNADNQLAVALMQIRNTPPPLPADLPGPVRALVERTMAKDPHRRFPTGGVLAEAIRAVQDECADLARLYPVPNQPSPGQSVPPVPPGPPGPSVPPGPPAQSVPPGQAGPAGPGSAAPPFRPTQPPPFGPSGPVRLRERSSHPSRWAIWIAAAVILILAVVGVVSVMSSRSVAGHGADDGSAPARRGTGTAVPTRPVGTPGAGSTSTPTSHNDQGGDGGTSSAGPLVSLNPNDLLGRTSTEVVAALRQLGLEPALRKDSTTGGKPGTVVGVSPTGPVAPGTTITVVVASDSGHGSNK